VREFESKRGAKRGGTRTARGEKTIHESLLVALGTCEKGRAKKKRNALVTSGEEESRERERVFSKGENERAGSGGNGNRASLGGGTSLTGNQEKEIKKRAFNEGEGVFVRGISSAWGRAENSLETAPRFV